MTGRQIHNLREMLKIDQFALAGVLGVHVSTVYRWESRTGKVKMDPLQAQIVDLLRERVAAKPQIAGALGQTIVRGLVTGGPLVALAALLVKLLDGKGPGDDA